MKQCTKCGEVLDLSFFYKDKRRSSGLQAQCKKCVSEYSRKRWKENPEFRERQIALAKQYRQRPEVKEARRKWIKDLRAKRHRHGAERAVNRELEAGRMAPASACICEDCREKPAEHLHHHSYERDHWLDVIPLCRSCHNKRHLLYDS